MMWKGRSVCDVVMVLWTIGGIGSTLLTLVLTQLDMQWAVAVVPAVYLVLGFGIVLPCITTWSGQRWFISLVGKISKKFIAVELIGYNLTRQYSIATIRADGRLRASCYWMNNIGDCILLPNGAVDPNSYSSYQYFWIPLDKKDRVEFLLKNNLPDFDTIQSLSNSDRFVVMHNLRKELCQTTH